MNIEEYESIPDSISSSEVHKYTMNILTSSESVFSALSKLDIIADRQWHTYVLPSTELQAALRKWLISNWVSNSQEYMESILALSYCFGLDKELYQKALENYSGEHKAEFQKNLSKSLGKTINPWWSMERKNA